MDLQRLRSSYLQFFKKFSNFRVNEFDKELLKVQEYANGYGLSEEDLELIISVVLKNKIAPSKIKAVMACLIPESYVPENVLRILLRWLLMNHRKNIPLTSVKAVMEWLIIMIENKLVRSEIVHLYYDLFFLILMDQRMIALASRLIYLLTRTQDVNRWYVKQVLNVHEMYGKPKSTTALLYLFKIYKPQDVPEQLPAYSVHSVFKPITNKFTESLQRVQSKIPRKGNVLVTFNNRKPWIGMNKDGKSIFTELEYINSDANDIQANSIYLNRPKDSELSKYLVLNIYPSNVQSLIYNLQGLHMLLFSEKSVQERFCVQLYHTLHHAFIQRNPLVSQEDKNSLWNCLTYFLTHIQQSVPICSKFLVEYFMRWDGFENKVNVYKLVSWIDFHSYQELRECILDRLLLIFLTSTPDAKCDVLNTLGDLSINIISSRKSKVPKKFLVQGQKLDLDSELNKLYDFIDHLCKLGLYLDHAHPIVIHGVIRLNEKILMVESKFKLNKWKINEFLCYSVLFSCSPVAINNFCSFVVRFPKTIKKQIVTDYLNCIWNNNAFCDGNGSIFKKMSHVEDILMRYSSNVNSIYGLNHNFALECYNYSLNKKSNQLEHDMKHYKLFHGNILKFIAAYMLRK